ncbi:MAG: type II toxin-antitoxin system VapC family toxin [Deltaproteobacteria bacterium]|nr:type II toxin-antitoxin system VapC family toxin [Deltaproteobacteria bacterium]
MKILLDTHVWLWYLEGSKSLPSRLRKFLDAGGNEIWLSPISVWEAVMLAEKGKIKVQPDPQSFVRQSLAAFPVRQAPLTIEVALKSREIPLPHNDPADRFLAATALVYDLKLATIDKVLSEVQWLPKV